MSASKICFKCGRRKRLTSFYTHPMMGDGHLNKCKTCAKMDSRARDPEKRRAYDRMRNKTPERRRAQAERLLRARKTMPGRIRARAAVATALRTGRIVRKPCEACGETKGTQAHHDDYRRPLAIRWLCVRCHNKHHRETGQPF